MLTERQVDGMCERIERDVRSFEEDPERVAELRGAMEALRSLRDQYADNKTMMAPYVDRLSEYSRRLRASISAARQRLTEKYLQASRAVKKWREIREGCRDALLELVRAENVECFQAEQGWIEIHATRTVSLPDAGTSEREEVLALITQAGLWAEVGQPNGHKLLRALDGGRFSPEAAARVAELCPVRTVHRLAGKAQDGREG